MSEDLKQLHRGEPCRSCGAPIVFLKTERGKSMPVDATTIDVADEYFDRDRHTSHFATCPQAKKWRRDGGKR